MTVTEKELADVRRELEKQERELSELARAAANHRGVALELASELDEELGTAVLAMEPRKVTPVHIVRA
jgi:hypothetical protein